MNFNFMKPGDFVVSVGTTSAVWSNWDSVPNAAPTIGSHIGTMWCDEPWLMIACTGDLACVLKNNTCGWVRRNWIGLCPGFPGVE